jgi:RNA-directed DNA polymerase
MASLYDTANVFTKLTTLKGVLPQGAPSSPVIANLVAVEMIKEISSFVEPFNITFTSYLYDLCFSSNTNFKRLVPEIIAMIKRNYFFPAYKKIHYRIGSCEITGLIVSGNELRIIP